jgi:aldehyde dehydrogenase (NAD+)
MNQSAWDFHEHDIYVGGEWTKSTATEDIEVFNPATGTSIGTIPAGGDADVDVAVRAAAKAGSSWARTAVDERVELLRRILDGYSARRDELAAAITSEMGAPVTLSRGAQTAAGIGHLTTTIDLLGRFSFQSDEGPTRIVREPIGVCGMITPWNWPLHQILAKVAPALAAGCTMVLKPSEIAPFDAVLFAEIIHDAGVPAGVFNLVHGRGIEAGAAISGHPDVDLVSFTGSTRGGIAVAINAAPTVKRVTQELGGKSPNILLDDVDLEPVVRRGVAGCFVNSGQSCSALTRMLVPAGLHDQAAEIAAAAASEYVTGDPLDPVTQLGPIVSEIQFERVQGLIEAGVKEGARLVAGGPGRPDGLRDGLERGWFARPTVFAGVDNDMAIARNEIFGPVLSVIPYGDEEEAVRIANDTEYGLSAAVSSADPDRAEAVARCVRAGQVQVNAGGSDRGAPFGGYKRSGNGREMGAYGLNEYLEVKALLGGGGQ